MILVTVGTSRFDALVREVSNLVMGGHITEDVYAQIGDGEFEPHNIKQFRRFVPSLDKAMNRASLIITHAGVGTCFEVLRRGIPFIVVPNKELSDDHQQEIVCRIEDEKWGIVCHEIDELLDCYRLSKSFRPSPCTIFSDENRLDFVKILEEVMR